MKFFCIGLLILCLLLCACYFATHRVDEVTGSVLRPLEKALERDGAGDPAGRRVWIDTAQVRWQRSLPLLTCLLDHGLTGEIDDGIADLQLLDGRDFQRSCTHLIRRLHAIVERDRPRLGNVL